ncbi:MAG: ComF family protein, partial [Oscillospiraceae bacterium]
MSKHGFFSALLDLIYPPRCVFCRSLLSRGEREVCNTCKASLPYTEGASKVQTGEFFDGCWSALYYEDSVRESILRYKFNGRTEYAKYYAKLLAEIIRENLSGKYELITWVPLSKEREKDRGYDQSMLLAMAVAVELDDVAVETLQKISNVPA